jgi:hypothetical protein
MDLVGTSATSSAAFIFADINGVLDAYSYTTQTLITSVVLSSLEGTTLGGSDFAFTATGTAFVNGVQRRIQVRASQHNVASPVALVTFEIVDAETGVVLARGTAQGETAGLHLTLNR